MIGEERRKDDSKIDVLTERLNSFMAVTTEYRKSLCSKIDVVIEKVNNLPCRERFENTKGIKLQLKALWAVTGGMVIAIIHEWVRSK